jgi:hypothetical protein
MKTAFKVQVLSFANIMEIAGTRTVDHYAALLDALEYGDQSDLSDGDKRDMCVLALQGLEPEEAAYQVLKHDMSDVLRDGQMRNIAGEMQDEKLWEEYSNSALHERLFTVGSLLYAAFPGVFPKPDAVRVELEVTALNAAAKALLTASPHESFVVRLLADGMEPDAVLHRLYGDQLAGPSFPEAAEVVWIVNAQPAGDDALRLEIISSGYWLDPLDGTKSYDSAAYADAAR